MRIIFLLTQSMDSPDGLGRIGPLAKELSRFGHKISIIALHPDYHNLKINSQEFDGVCVTYVAQMHVIKKANEKRQIKGLALFFNMLNATLHLFLRAWKTPTDLIYICKPHPMNSLAGLLVGWLRRKPVWLDSDDYESASGHFSHRWQKNVISWFEKTIPRHTKYITVNTQFMKQKFLTWGIPEDKMYYLSNGVDRERFARPNQESVNRLAGELGLRDVKVILYIGSLSMPSHPVDLLIQAFKIIHMQYPETKLVIVGGGEEYQPLLSMVRDMGILDHVIFCGRVPAEEVPLYYALGDVAIDPVRGDDAARGRAPLKLFESWACGVPFVTGDVGDRMSLLGDPPAGILTAPGDPDQLAQSILSVLNDPSLVENLIELGWLRVERYYWDVLAAEFNNRQLSKIDD